MQQQQRLQPQQQPQRSQPEAGEAELDETIDVLGCAIDVLLKEMAKNPAVMEQVDTKSFDNMMKSLDAFMSRVSFAEVDKPKIVALMQSQQESENEDWGVPATATYKMHSTNILDVFEDMKYNAEEQLNEMRACRSIGGDSVAGASTGANGRTC